LLNALRAMRKPVRKKVVRRETIDLIRRLRGKYRNLLLLEALAGLKREEKARPD
jgi:hypothetical protein